MNRSNKQVVKRNRDGPAALLEVAYGALRNITANNDNRVKCGAAVRAVIPHLSAALSAWARGLI